MMSQIATANRLIDGEVVFLGTYGWVETIERASVARSDGEIRALEALAKQSEAVNEVVGSYLVDVRDEGRRRGWIGEIRDDEMDADAVLVPERIGQLFESIAPARREDEPEASRCQQLREGFADSRRRSGDERGLARAFA